MSIQINGIDKPKSCFDCPCIDNEFAECAAKEHYLLPKDEYGAVLGDVPDWCPITELQTCEDAINRADAIRVASGYCHPANVAKELAKLPVVHPQQTCEYWDSESEFCALCRPSAQPRMGKWIHIRTEEDGNALYECSECHMGEVHVPIVEVKYCWNCGAKMEAET